LEVDPPDSYFIEFLLAGIFGEWSLLMGFFILFILLICSALISGSEVAFFSLSPNDLHDLNQSTSKKSDRLIALKEKPRSLLATILITNNFINIAIIIISDYLLRIALPVGIYYGIAHYIAGITNGNITTIISILNFLVAVAGVTFLLVLFGEVAPKIYASINNKKFAMFMTKPMEVLIVIFSPLGNLLVSWTDKIEKKFEDNNSSTSKQEIDKAIDLTVSQEVDADTEADILKGILKFADSMVKQIMKSRVDVVALDIIQNYGEVLDEIKESGYSRIPVYQENFDNLFGLLYIKDLLGHHSEERDYEWQKHIRTNLMYVPETKKLDELLKEFQQKKMHMAIVVDEFGGSSGIVTLEDVMEEVIGEIRDEFDEQEEVEYEIIDEWNYIFEGKTMLNDVCRILGKDTSIFDTVKGEADSLAGLVLENVGYIPKNDREFFLENYKLKIVSVSKRRIEKIKITLLE